jgi:hypothetical protein
VVTKARVRQWLEQRFFLRIHMTLILAGTFLAGVVMTRLLLQGGVNVPAVRYAIAISVAYLMFLVLVKLWLLYVGSGAEVHPLDAVDFMPDSSSSAAPALRVGSVQSSTGGGSGSLDLDLGDDFFFAIVLVAVVILIGGIAIYFIYTAPGLLSEAAFEAVLAASLARRAKKAEGAGWLRPVMRATVVPFLAVLAISGFLGWLAQQRCPDAVMLRDALHCSTVRTT